MSSMAYASALHVAKSRTLGVSRSFVHISMTAWRERVTSGGCCAVLSIILSSKSLPGCLYRKLELDKHVEETHLPDEGTRFDCGVCKSFSNADKEVVRVHVEQCLQCSYESSSQDCRKYLQEQVSFKHRPAQWPRFASCMKFWMPFLQGFHNIPDPTPFHEARDHGSIQLGSGEGASTVQGFFNTPLPASVTEAGDHDSVQLSSGEGAAAGPLTVDDQPPADLIYLSEKYHDIYSKMQDALMAQEVPAGPESPVHRAQFCVAFVGEAGVGKGCVINHITNSLDVAHTGNCGEGQAKRTGKGGAGLCGDPGLHCSYRRQRKDAHHSS